MDGAARLSLGLRPRVEQRAGDVSKGGCGWGEVVGSPDDRGFELIVRDDFFQMQIVGHGGERERLEIPGHVGRCAVGGAVEDPLSVLGLIEDVPTWIAVAAEVTARAARRWPVEP